MTDNDFLARADADAKLQLIKQIVLTSRSIDVDSRTRILALIEDKISKVKVFRDYRKPQSMES